MKRYGYLWEKFISEENFKLAFKNASRGRHSVKSIRIYESNLDENLENLRRKLNLGLWKHGPYRHRTVFEPKKRDISICRFEDRIVHWAIVNIIQPIFEPTFISAAYACRKGFGQHKASQKVAEYTRKYEYVYKFDHSKYYPTMDHDYLKSRICSKIKDERFLNVVFGVIDSQEIGVPIGNLTSQIFGNIYRTPLDRTIKEKLSAKAYVNYMDDGMVFSNDKEFLREVKREVESFVKNVQKQKLSKSEIFKTNRGVDALGYRHFKRYILLRKRTVRRMKRSFARLQNLTYESVLGKIASAMGVLKHCCSKHLSDKLKIKELFGMYMKKFSEIRHSNDCLFEGTHLKIDEILNKEITLLGFKAQKSKLNNDDYVIIAFELKGEKHVTFTGSKILREKLAEYANEIPFSVTITRPTGKNYYAFV